MGRGRTYQAHQIRAVALSATGSAGADVRAKDLEYVENVDVDVVQITAIVTTTTDVRHRIDAEGFSGQPDGGPTITSFSTSKRRSSS